MKKVKTLAKKATARALLSAQRARKGFNFAGREILRDTKALESAREEHALITLLNQKGLLAATSKRRDPVAISIRRLAEAEMRLRRDVESQMAVNADKKVGARALRRKKLAAALKWARKNK